MSMSSNTATIDFTPSRVTLAQRPAGNINQRVVAAAIVLFAVGAVYLANTVHWRQAVLFLVGGGFGVILYHAAFGFTSSWRVLISDRRGAGVRAQMMMLAVACLLFFPVLESGTPLFTETVRGNVNPIGISVVVGAFLFGLGMQLGGACGSGTLFPVSYTHLTLPTILLV